MEERSIRKNRTGDDLPKVEIAPETTASVEVVLTPYGEAVERFRNAIEQGKYPTLAQMRLALESAQSPGLEKKSITAEKQISHIKEVLEQKKNSEGEKAMLEELLRYLYTQVEYTYTDNSLIQTFDPKNPVGNCESIAMAGATLLEELGYVPDRIGLRSFKTHLQLLFQDEQGEWQVLEGSKVSPAKHISGTTIQLLNEAKRISIGLWPDVQKFSLPTAEYHPEKEGPMSKWLQNGWRAMKERVDVELNQLFPNKVDGMNIGAGATADSPLLISLLSAWHALPKNSRRAAALAAFAGFMYGARVNEQISSEQFDSPAQAIAHDYEQIEKAAEVAAERITAQVKKALPDSVKKRIDNEPTDNSNTKSTSDRDKKKYSSTPSSVPEMKIQAEITEAQANEIIAKGKYTFSAADLVLDPPAGLEQPTPDSTISFYDTPQARTFTLPETITQIDQSFWNYLFSDLQKGAYTQIQAHPQASLEPIVIDITATGMQQSVPHAVLFSAMKEDGKSRFLYNDIEFNNQDVSRIDWNIIEQIQKLPIVICLNGQEIFNTQNQVLNRADAQKIIQMYRVDLREFDTIPAEEFDYIVSNLSHQSIQIRGDQKLPSIHWEGKDNYINLIIEDIAENTEWMEGMQIHDLQIALNPNFTNMDFLQKINFGGGITELDLILQSHKTTNTTLEHIPENINNLLITLDQNTTLTIDGYHQEDGRNIVITIYDSVQQISLRDVHSSSVEIRYRQQKENNAGNVVPDIIPANFIQQSNIASMQFSYYKPSEVYSNSIISDPYHQLQQGIGEVRLDGVEQTGSISTE